MMCIYYCLCTKLEPELEKKKDPIASPLGFKSLNSQVDSEGGKKTVCASADNENTKHTRTYTQTHEYLYLWGTFHIFINVTHQAARFVTS